MKIIFWSLGTETDTGYFLEILHPFLEKQLGFPVVKAHMTDRESRIQNRVRQNDNSGCEQVQIQNWGLLGRKYRNGIYEKPDLAVLILPRQFRRALFAYQQEPVLRQCPVIYVFGEYSEQWVSMGKQMVKEFRLEPQGCGCVPANEEMETAFKCGRLREKISAEQRGNSFKNQCYLREVERTAFLIARETERIIGEEKICGKYLNSMEVQL